EHRLSHKHDDGSLAVKDEGIVKLRPRLEQQRGDFIQVAAPHHPGVRTRTLVERMTDVMLRQKLRETLGRVEDAVLFSAADPEQSKFLVRRLAVGDEAR